MCRWLPAATPPPTRHCHLHQGKYCAELFGFSLNRDKIEHRKWARRRFKVFRLLIKGCTVKEGATEINLRVFFFKYYLLRLDAASTK